MPYLLLNKEIKVKNKKFLLVSRGFSYLFNFCKGLRLNKLGATSVEYALMAGIVATILIVAGNYMSGKLGNSLNKIGNALQNNSNTL